MWQTPRSRWHNSGGRRQVSSGVGFPSSRIASASTFVCMNWSSIAAGVSESASEPNHCTMVTPATLSQLPTAQCCHSVAMCVCVCVCVCVRRSVLVAF